MIGKRFGGWVLLVVGAVLLSALPARADIIAAVQFVTAGQGSSNNAIEVTLMNTGVPVTVAGFAFTVTTADPDITFTGSDFSTLTALYLFPPADSFDQLNGFTLNTLGPGASMDGTDLSNSNLGTMVGTGATVGLGRVLFNVLPNATPGAFAVDLVPGVTNLNDPAFAAIKIDTLSAGQITVTSTTVPEPASFLLLGGALLCLGLRKRLLNCR